MPKKKGRPFKIRHHVDIEQPEPVFIPFICEWTDCRRELHNLETLRLHISIVHKKRVDGKLPCLWRDCSKTEAARMQFRSRQEWKQHIEEKHLIPFAWHMGDGPKGTDLSGKPKDTINPLWLTDSSGTQVTPSVAKQPLEDRRASKNNAKRFRKMRGSEEYAIKGVSKGSQQLGIGGGMGMAMAPPPLVGGSSEDEEDGGDTGMDDGHDEGGGDTGIDEEGEDMGVDEDEVDMVGAESRGREIEDSEEDADGDEDEDMDDDGDVQMQMRMGIVNQEFHRVELSLLK
ncbi:hypothetical protein DL95DRAFT_321658 [Leptodontidium sp. 2 PMI_412]|nr:hypothetical protein DL95DRAFT_321658 [Leptodontidium sp. 2 PMI_412]